MLPWLVMVVVRGAGLGVEVAGMSGGGGLLPRVVGGVSGGFGRVLGLVVLVLVPVACGRVGDDGGGVTGPEEAREQLPQHALVPSLLLGVVRPFGHRRT